MTTKKGKKLSKKEQEELKKIGMHFLQLREDYPMPDEKMIKQNALIEKIKEKTGIELKNTRISAIENCKDKPTFKEILAYNKFFDVPIEYLIGYTDSREYQNIKVNQEYGLSDEALQTITNIKNRNMVGNTLNEFFSKKNEVYVEALLCNINEYIKLLKEQMPKEDYQELAKKLYCKEVGKKREDFDSKDIKSELYGMKFLNPISSKQTQITKEITLTKFQISEHLNTIINNIIKERK